MYEVRICIDFENYEYVMSMTYFLLQIVSHR